MKKNTKKLDPNQEFIVASITREEIANNLNCRLTMSTDNTVDDIIKGDDPRLTNKLCQSYATRIGEIDDDDEDSYERLQEEYLTKLGVNSDDL